MSEATLGQEAIDHKVVSYAYAGDECLPAGWEYKPLGQAATILAGVGFPKALQGQTDGAYPVFKVGNISAVWKLGQKRLTVSSNNLSEEDAVSIRAKVHPENTIVFAKIGEALRLNRRAMLACPAIFDNNVMGVLADSEQLDADYLYYYMLTVDLGVLSRATTVPSIRKSDVEQIAIPIAPRDQQDRIVAEIEKQFSRLDEAIASLKRVKANLKRYKAAVLKAAVEGKLTEEWRKQNLPAPTSRPGRFYTYAILCDNDSIYIGHTDNIEARWSQHCQGNGAEWTKNHKPIKIVHYEEFATRKEAADREKWLKTGYGRKWLKRENDAGRTRQAGHVEPASKLLERILTERRTKWEEAELAKMKAKGKEPKDDKWKEKFKYLAAPDLANLPQLPATWVWASPEQLASTDTYSLAIGPFGSNLKVKDYRDSGVPLIFVRNIRKADFGEVDAKYVDSDKATELNAHSVDGGDILITKMCDPPGEACIYPIDSPRAIITADCIKWRLSELLIYKGYFVDAINSHCLAEQIRKITKGVAQQKVSLARFRVIAIPVPPLTEQFVVEDIVAGIHSLIVAQEQQVEMAIKRSESLRQSILGTAFCGVLQ